MISTKVHSLFGYSLMAAGIARMVEVCFVLHDQPSGSSVGQPSGAEYQAPREWQPIRAFQYLPPYLLVASGVLFMSATDEEMRWADNQGVDHATWALIDYSMSLFIFFWMNVLIDLYVAYGGRYGAARANQERSTAGDRERGAGAGGASLYSRLSTGRNQTVNAGAETHEMNGLPAHRVRVKPNDDEPQNHVLFDEEDQDPFEEKDERSKLDDDDDEQDSADERSRIRL